MQRRARQRGFSLIELMVAMTITLIISGAIYGLLSSGQSAFRREPALVDRQQNIRIAMDLIVRDIQNGGAGMTTFTQVFTDDNPPNSMNDPGPALGSVPSEIFPGQRADFIEILGNDGTCPTLSVCGTPGAALMTSEPLPACIFGNPPRPSLGFASGTAGPAESASNNPGLLWFNVPGPGGGGGCGAGAGFSGGVVNTASGLAPAFNPPGSACDPGGAATPKPNANNATNFCQSISRVQLVRYEIAPETPGTAVNIITNPPALWRSDYGRRDIDTGATANAGPYIGANSPWQLVARGIDDMQIQYFRGGAWSNTGGQVVNANFNTIVQQVRVTLSARALAIAGPTAGGASLGGETIYAPGGTAGRRGQLTTTVSPRAALIGLASGQQWR